MANFLFQQMEASCNDVSTDLSTGNHKRKPVSHRTSMLAMVGHSKFNPQVSNNRFAHILHFNKVYIGFSLMKVLRICMQVLPYARIVVFNCIFFKKV